MSRWQLHNVLTSALNDALSHDLFTEVECLSALTKSFVTTEHPTRSITRITGKMTMAVHEVALLNFLVKVFAQAYGHPVFPDAANVSYELGRLQQLLQRDASMAKALSRVRRRLGNELIQAEDAGWHDVHELLTVFREALANRFFMSVSDFKQTWMEPLSLLLRALKGVPLLLDDCHGLLPGQTPRKWIFQAPQPYGNALPRAVYNSLLTGSTVQPSNEANAAHDRALPGGYLGASPNGTNARRGAALRAAPVVASKGSIHVSGVVDRQPISPDRPSTESTAAVSTPSGVIPSKQGVMMPPSVQWNTAAHVTADNSTGVTPGLQESNATVIAHETSSKAVVAPSDLSSRKDMQAERTSLSTSETPSKH